MSKINHKHNMLITRALTSQGKRKCDCVRKINSIDEGTADRNITRTSIGFWSTELQSVCLDY